MILRGINFGPVLGASGVQGFFGEKYLHQKLSGPLGPNLPDALLWQKPLRWKPEKAICL